MANNFKPSDLKEIIAVHLPAAFTTCLPRHDLALGRRTQNRILIELLWLSAQSAILVTEKKRGWRSARPIFSRCRIHFLSEAIRMKAMSGSLRLRVNAQPRRQHESPSATGIAKNRNR
jgi:hypothetical protein